MPPVAEKGPGPPEFLPNPNQLLPKPSLDGKGAIFLIIVVLKNYIIEYLIISNFYFLHPSNMPFHQLV